jgi:hypothetical protein
MLGTINNGNRFFFIEKKTHRSDEKVWMKQIECAVRRVNVKKEVTLYPDPNEKT